MSFGYSLFDYGSMIGPGGQVRVGAYAEALRRTISPEKIVLEIGTGAGFFALLAAKLRARHVYAVDPNDAIRVARRLAAANGCADRITFVQDLSTNITLPQKADVIISDIGGALPWLGGHIPSIVDARERLLAPGGILIPRQASVWAAAVCAPELYAQHVAPWGENPYGLDLSAARALATNWFRKSRFQATQLLTAPCCWATLDYRTITSPHVKAAATMYVRRAGTGHGLCLWFDSLLCDGVEFSNAPEKPHIAMYSQMFFPWSAPVALAENDEIRVKFCVRLQDGQYIWGWHSRVLAGGSGEEKASFKQARFPRMPVVPAGLTEKTAPSSDSSRAA
jgi:protein arginine N-methyltransferase 1